MTNARSESASAPWINVFFKKNTHMRIIIPLYLTLIALIMSAFPEQEPPHLFLSLRVMFIMLIKHFVLTVWLLKSSCTDRLESRLVWYKQTA